MIGYQFVWNVRCAVCLAAAVGDELHCQSWAATHRCPPSTSADEAGEPNPSTTRPEGA